MKCSICLSFCGARWRRGNNIRRWSTGFFIAAAIIGIFSVFYGQSVDRFVSAFDFYDTSEQLRQVYLNQRLDSYARFFPLLAVVLLLWAAVLHFHDYLSELKPSVTLFVSIFLVTIVADYFFSTREWIRFGRPCWDYYCTYAQLIYDSLIHAPPAAKENLLRFLATDYHANSPVGPLLTVAAMLLTKMSAISAYRLACGLATLSTLALVWRYLLKPLALDPSEKWAVMLLLSAHLIVARSFVFPQTDAFVLMWTTALLVCGWAWLERPTWQKRVGCFFILTSGLFVKLSFLPALALLPLWKAAQGPRGRPALVALIKEGAFFGLLPFVVYRLFQSAFNLTLHYRVELNEMAGKDSNIPYILMSVLHAGLFLGYLVFIERRELKRKDFFLLGWIGLYLASLWTARAAGWDRFYLAILPALAVVSSAGLSRLKKEWNEGVMWCFVGLYIVVNYAALWLNLYY